jgi:hypothetical protein
MLSVSKNRKVPPREQILHNVDVEGGRCSLSMRGSPVILPTNCSNEGSNATKSRFRPPNFSPKSSLPLLPSVQISLSFLLSRPVSGLLSQIEYRVKNEHIQVPFEPQDLRP